MAAATAKDDAAICGSFNSAGTNGADAEKEDMKYVETECLFYLNQFFLADVN
jgi:hypothetical protein